MNTITFTKNHKDAVTPTKAGPNEVGWDLTAISVFKKLSDRTALYDTGISVKPPPGFYTEIIPRSSLSKTGYMLSNSVGIVDPTYRGNLLIALTKVDDELSCNLVLPFKKTQLVLRKFEQGTMQEVKDLDTTKRGTGGFGSTDKVTVPETMEDMVLGC